MLLIEDGIVPDSWFLARSKDIKPTIFPMVDGIEPLKLFKLKRNCCKDVKFPIEDGIGPES